MKALFFTRFAPVANGNGGMRRCTQIHDALSPLLNYTLETSVKRRETWQIDRKWFGLKYRWLKFRNPYLSYWKGAQRDYAEMNFHFAAEWAEQYRDNLASAEVVLMDDPLYFPPVAELASGDRKRPLIVFAHNIESLSVEHVREDKVLALLAYETALFKKADLCVTISREETFLLKNLGANVFYFPYYPPASIEARMQMVRRHREKCRKQGLLFIGTAHNTPTGNGLIKLIEAWRDHHMADTGHTLYVAGYGTEDFKIHAEGVKGVIFLGAVDNKVLDRLLCDVLCAVVYQATGSGALTKIDEFLLAGVPILANAHAMRNHYNIEGIVEYASFSDIPKLIETGGLESVQCTLPQKPDVAKLRDAIIQIKEKKAI